MAPQSHLPPLLSPLIRHRTPPAGSLTLLTSVLANTTNWLLLRFLYRALKSSPDQDVSLDGDSSNKVRVIFVSWLRAWEWWKEGGRKLVSLEMFVFFGYVQLSFFLSPLFFGFFGFRFELILGVWVLLCYFYLNKRFIYLILGREGERLSKRKEKEKLMTDELCD